MSPICTRRTSHGSMASSSSSSIDISMMSDVLLLSTSPEVTTRSPRKHMRSKQQLIRSSSFDDDDDNVHEKRSGECWYELKDEEGDEEEDEEEDTGMVGTTRHYGRSQTVPSRYYSVPNNTPGVMVYNNANRTAQNNTKHLHYPTPKHTSIAAAAATRLLFHDLEPEEEKSTLRMRSTVVLPREQQRHYQFQKNIHRNEMNGSRNCNSSLDDSLVWDPSLSPPPTPQPSDHTFISGTTTGSSPTLSSRQGGKRNSFERPRPPVSPSKPFSNPTTSSAEVSIPSTGSRHSPIYRNCMSFDTENDEDRVIATRHYVPIRTNHSTVAPATASAMAGKAAQTAARC